MEWYPPSEQEISIVAELLEGVNGSQEEEQHVELSITDPLQEGEETCRRPRHHNLLLKKVRLPKARGIPLLNVPIKAEYVKRYGNGSILNDKNNKAEYVKRYGNGSILNDKNNKAEYVERYGNGSIHNDKINEAEYVERYGNGSVLNDKNNLMKKTFKRGFIPCSFDSRSGVNRNIVRVDTNVSQGYGGGTKIPRKRGRPRRHKFDGDGLDVGIFPVKIAARKEVNRHHFDRFYVDSEGKKHLADNDLQVEGRIEVKKEKQEFFSQDEEEGFVEMCEVSYGKECSSVELEYGSGVSIYESVEMYDNSDNETSFKAKTEPKVFRCNRCPHQFPDRRTLMLHKSSAHKKAHSHYQCQQCNAVYKRAYKYHSHMGGHDGRFSCDQCHRTFVRVTGLKKHLRQCHKVVNPHVCVVCGRFFTSHESLDSHLLEDHPNEADSLRSFFKQCVHCRYQFVTEFSYLNHQKNAPYKCKECDLSFQCNNKLGIHLNFKHKPQSCGHCDKKFDAFDQYTYHVRYYHTDKHLKCPYCDEYFRVRSRLLIHIDVNHTEGHNYKCNQCDYTAKNYASVNRHRRIAHMPKNETHKNVCETCGKSFLVLSRLKVHMKSHSDAKPHVCQVCGRGYKFEYLLKKHQSNPELCLRILFPNGTRLERKGKRRCDMCNLGFSSPDQLALHMVEVHDVKIETREANASYVKREDEQQDPIQLEGGPNCVELSSLESSESGPFHIAESHQYQSGMHHKDDDDTKSSLHPDDVLSVVPRGGVVVAVGTDNLPTLPTVLSNRFVEEATPDESTSDASRVCLQVKPAGETV